MGHRQRTLLPALVLFASLGGCGGEPGAIDESEGSQGSAQEAEGAVLARTHQCAQCHDAARTLVGPAWGAVATRYAGDPTAASTLASRVRQGSVGRWGQVPMPSMAQVPTAELAKILAWILTRPDAPAPSETYVSGGSSGTSSSSDPTVLVKDKLCLACHAIDRKVVGPSFRDIATRYAGTAGAVERLATKVRSGTSGSWGQVPMPANPQVTGTEASILVDWILSL